MKILIYVHSPTWFTELSLLGRYIHHLPGHEIVFFIIDYRHPMMHEHARMLREEGIACILECEIEPPRDFWVDKRGLSILIPSPGADAQLARGTRAWLERIDRNSASEFRAAHKELTHAIANSRAMIRLHQPDVIILGGDNPGYTTAGLIEGAHREGIPAVLVPSTMSNGLEEAEVYSSDPRYHVIHSPARMVSKLFPHWSIVHKGVQLLRCPPGRALALESLQIAPPQPWAFNSGSADAIAAESEAMMDYAAAAGLPRERMVATGSPSDDIMSAALADAAGRRRTLYDELGLPLHRPMLLTALPPDFLYVTGGRPQCDFHTYAELVEFWIDTLANQETFNVCVALHPSVKVEAMRHIELPNVRISTRRTSEVVPLCDLYVASVSSTIRWAIACGKPVINYDVYRYRYTDFLNVGGVLATEVQETFRDLVRRLSDEPNFLAQLRQRQVAAASRWGFLDGRCMERILRLLDGVVNPG